MYRVTLSIPVYNVEKYVERALLSALNQTFESIEYLIVDDKGTDNSMDIVQQIIASHSRGKDVRIIDHGINQGLGAARNSAIKEAKGEYFYCMDSDDEITKDCIEILYNKMQENPVDFVCGSRDMIKLDGVIKKYKFINCILENNWKIIDYQEKAVIPIPVYTWNKLYSLEFLRKNKIKCIPHHLSEDQIFTFLVLFYVNSCTLISDITYHYYENNSSLMGRLRLQKGYDYKLANEAKEVLDFQKDYIKLHTHPYMLLICNRYILRMAGDCFNIIDSSAFSLIEKVNYIKQYLNFRDFPIKFHDIKILKGKFYFLISIFPKYILYIMMYYIFFVKKIYSFLKSKL
ncbi:putative glycosyltransferase EpsH [termite gut metagenome]|uniref:Putative glycosyltransferase EpsH n=1 Tax=termite gut metagenome TaxID=433724 RepID=A0A5J4SB57_9ZZZZ